MSKMTHWIQLQKKWGSERKHCTAKEEKKKKKKDDASQAILNSIFIFCGTSPWQPPQQHQHPSHKPQGMEKSFPLPASTPHSWRGHSHSPEFCSLLSPSGVAPATWNRGFQRCHGTELWLRAPRRAQRQQYWSLKPTAQERVSLQIWLGGSRVCCHLGPKLLWLSLRRWQNPEPEALQMGNTTLLSWRHLMYLTHGALKWALIHLFSKVLYTFFPVSKVIVFPGLQAPVLYPTVSNICNTRNLFLIRSNASKGTNGRHHMQSSYRSWMQNSLQELTERMISELISALQNPGDFLYICVCV